MSEKTILVYSKHIHYNKKIISGIENIFVLVEPCRKNIPIQVVTYGCHWVFKSDTNELLFFSKRSTPRCRPPVSSPQLLLMATYGQMGETLGIHWSPSQNCMIFQQYQSWLLICLQSFLAFFLKTCALYASRLLCDVYFNCLFCHWLKIKHIADDLR